MLSYLDRNFYTVAYKFKSCLVETVGWDGKMKPTGDSYGSDFPNIVSFSIHEFLATCQDYPYVMADSLLDVLTKGGHSRTLQELETVRRLLKNRVIYYWLSALVTECYETRGVTRVTAGLPSPERQPSLGVDRGWRTMNGNE